MLEYKLHNKFQLMKMEILSVMSQCSTNFCLEARSVLGVWDLVTGGAELKPAAAGAGKL